MTAERRSALLAWAHERQALIIEDDYDVEYRFGREPVASLQGLAPDRVVFVGTTSKTLAPALRQRAIGLGARDVGVAVHELHRHCTTVAPYAPALLLGFALPGESDLAPAVRLLAGVARDGALASGA
jgi:hypothetical protein